MIDGHFASLLGGPRSSDALPVISVLAAVARPTTSL
jgi:hypothetical protein